MSTMLHNHVAPRYGVDDQAGSFNEATVGGVLRAARLVRNGHVFDLSHVLDQHVPAFAGRTYKQVLNTTAHQLNRRRPGAGRHGWGENDVNWIVEQIEATQQMGTHVDALNHLQVGDHVYNGWTLDEIIEEYGTNRLGIDTLPQLVTRGLLIDVAKLRGVRRLSAGEVIDPATVQEILDRNDVRVEPGDAVLFHTGWGAQWTSTDAYLAGEPGPGMAMVEWLADRHVSLVGCDTWSFGPVPPENPARPFEVPQTLNVHYGIVVAENLALGELAAAGVAEFMFVLSHARLRGATGAWVAPLAIT
ncbi:MAG TPA: cyclase family protein [Ilumatobacteraceae bacterium]|jgi:kynurenine formamidase